MQREKANSYNLFFLIFSYPRRKGPGDFRCFYASLHLLGPPIDIFFQLDIRSRCDLSFLTMG